MDSWIKSQVHKSKEPSKVISLQHYNGNIINSNRGNETQPNKDLKKHLVIVNDFLPTLLLSMKRGINILFWLCPNYGHADPPPSLLISLLWLMGSVLCSMGKIIKKFSDFYFSSYREKFIEN